MQQVIKKLESLGKINQMVEKYTEITDENLTIHGVLFFIPLDKYEVKVLIPAPFHRELLDKGIPTFKQILNHKEAMLLR
ncbi:hypothetical protein ACP6L2_06390 [Sphingobacterium lactis]|uniref:hypothetical protein n=1 Tax=Sphingobacterium lactis TaxID=797291 RepID=UPI003F81A9F4